MRVAHDFQPDGAGDGRGLVVYAGIWIATGLVALHRRPGNRVGLLMVALGFAVASGQLYWDASLPYTVFTALGNLELVITVHLFLAFPSGRLETSLERRFVVGVYGAWLVLVPLAALMRDPRGDDGCPECPTNPLRVVGLGHRRAESSKRPTSVSRRRSLRGHRRPARAEGASRARGDASRARPRAPDERRRDPPVRPLPDRGRRRRPGRGRDRSSWVGGAFTAIPIAFLVGLLRTRLQRSGVADLVVELRSLSRPDDVRDAIARALGDPSLELAFWLPADERYVDPRGSPLDVTTREGRAVTVLEHDGTRVAALVHDPALLDEPELLEAVAAAASLTLENARLQAELSAQLAEVRASRARIVEAGDAERRRLERDLHDGAQQRLLGIRLALQLARGRIADGDGAVDELLTEADAEVGGALEELRALARGIHPAILTDEGLAPAIAALARRAPVPIELTVSPERLPEPVEATAYFVASEALANVAKHARASRATIALARTNGRVAIEVTDDGVGGADAEGTGLRGLRDRVEALDGHLEVETQVGVGTRVTAVIPCA